MCHGHRFGITTPIIPKMEQLEEIRDREAPLLRRHKIPAIAFPLSTALLLADQVVKEELHLEDLGALMARFIE